MQISDNGVRFIKRFEAYMRALPDGSCTAYQAVLGRTKAGDAILDIPTIGWGCTKGVKMGDVWTKEQAEAALHAEIAEHEVIVNRVVTATLTQGQFDALVSFNFNCGKLPGSKLLQYVNAGRPDLAAAEFGRYVFAKKQRLRGLERRRAAEVALFLEPSAEIREHTPQQAEPPSVGQVVKENAGIVAKVGAAVSVVWAGIVTYIDSVMVAIKAAVDALTSIEPLRAVASQAGVNMRALGLGALVFALIFGASRLVKK